MRILSFTAGAGEMLCGSCIRDNGLARELGRRGHEVRLLPLYQKSRTDEASASEERIRLGGISLYVQHTAPLLGRVPALDSIFDSPRLLDIAGRFSSSTDPAKLGPLTVTTLLGDRGPAKRAVQALCDSLTGESVDVIVLPNSLLIGLARPLAEAVGAPVVVTFSGEDLFLSQLPDTYRDRALTLMREQVSAVSHFVGVSEHHAHDMAKRLGVPPERVSVVRLGVDPTGFPDAPRSVAPRADAPVTIGFLSRIAPEKGLDRLARAVRHLAESPEGQGDDAPSEYLVRAAGWMARSARGYLREAESVLSGVPRVSFEYLGELDREAKLRFLTEADVLALPAAFPEPKGLPAIEAMMAGTPVVAPQEGVYPALFDRTEGGVLAKSSDPEDFAAALGQLIFHPHRRPLVGARGFERAREHHSISHMAEDAEAAYEQAISLRAAA